MSKYLSNVRPLTRSRLDKNQKISNRFFSTSRKFFQFFDVVWIMAFIWYITQPNPRIICGSWFCVENKKRKKLEHTGIHYKMLAFFGSKKMLAIQFYKTKKNYLTKIFKNCMPSIFCRKKTPIFECSNFPRKNLFGISYVFYAKYSKKKQKEFCFGFF